MYKPPVSTTSLNESQDDFEDAKSTIIEQNSDEGNEFRTFSSNDIDGINSDMGKRKRVKTIMESRERKHTADFNSDENSSDRPIFVDNDSLVMG